MLMKEDYVSLETAKMLKGKGFDEPCNASRLKDGTLRIHNREQSWDEMMRTKIEYLEFLCPTLYEAQKWLKDRKGLVVEISYMSGDYYIYDVLTIPNHDLVGLANRIPTNYNTFQQALDAGIQEALKLI